jgi:hypothetical protein
LAGREQPVPGRETGLPDRKETVRPASVFGGFLLDPPADAGFAGKMMFLGQNRAFLNENKAIMKKSTTIMNKWKAILKSWKAILE